MTESQRKPYRSIPESSMEKVSTYAKDCGISDGTSAFMARPNRSLEICYEAGIFWRLPQQGTHGIEMWGITPEAWTDIEKYRGSKPHENLDRLLDEPTMQWTSKPYLGLRNFQHFEYMGNGRDRRSSSSPEKKLFLRSLISQFGDSRWTTSDFKEWCDGSDSYISQVLVYLFDSGIIEKTRNSRNQHVYTISHDFAETFEKETKS